jgi:hypothetical protein
MTAKPVKDEMENWTQDYSTYFWSSRPPFEVKFEIEKTIGLLLARDAAQTTHLTYSGSDNPPYIGREVQLSFEAALPKGNWYSLRVHAWVPRTWYTEAEFRGNADKAFGHWVLNLQAAPSLGLLDSATQDMYDRRVREAVEEEARLAGQKEDMVPVVALKQEILSELRKGKSLRTAHHEGGTTICFDGKAFVRSDWGEEESLKVFGTEEEALDGIREFYDWESRKDSYPHRPPEQEVWKFIQRELT